MITNYPPSKYKQALNVTCDIPVDKINLYLFKTNNVPRKIYDEGEGLFFKFKNKKLYLSRFFSMDRFDYKGKQLDAILLSDDFKMSLMGIKFAYGEVVVFTDFK